MRFFVRMLGMMLVCGLLAFADSVLHSSVQEDIVLSYQGQASQTQQLISTENHQSEALDFPNDDLLMPVEYSLGLTMHKLGQNNSLRIRCIKNSHLNLHLQYQEIKHFAENFLRRLFLQSKRFAPNFLLTSYSIFRI
ncbi:MAG: hypothetical protein IIX29_03885 [Bacteroidales bacterium]|nr:hypothetical protein [Bacteroidales bacterium]